MELTLKRFVSGRESTGGLLLVNGVFFCFTIEDQYQKVKVLKETRIPPGRYRIKFRDSGGMNRKYKEIFGEDHIGMLHLQDVPGFEWIYIHPGNTDEQTEGCILTGKGILNNLGECTTQQSTKAYIELYQLVKFAILNCDEQVHITVEDL